MGEEYGIQMAIENHIDFTADELLCLLTDANSPGQTTTCSTAAYASVHTNEQVNWS